MTNSGSIYRQNVSNYKALSSFQFFHAGTLLNATLNARAFVK